ncbi:alpha/beta hydrolase [Mycolicibacterium setense]
MIANQLAANVDPQSQHLWKGYTFVKNDKRIGFTKGSKLSPGKCAKSKLRGKWLIGVVAVVVVAVGVLSQVPLPQNDGSPAPEDDPTWEVRPIWIGTPPGDYGVRAAETRTLDDGMGWRQITVIRNVVDPTMTVIRPEPEMRTGASMVILPGGGFTALAWDSEGTEVGQFLAQRGITAFVLKYRVQNPRLWRLLPFLLGNVTAGIDPAISAAAADAIQAMRVIRDNADDYHIDTNRVGMMGFSAGAITLLRVLQASSADVRPDFAASIYGFLLEDGALPKSTPLFIAAAHPDPSVEDAKRIETIWKDAGAPQQTHIFESGNHGFGLGQPGTDSAQFRSLFGEWLAKR